MLVAIDDALVLCRGRRITRFALTSRAFHRIKSAAHAPVAVVTALVDGAGRALPAATRRALGALRRVSVAALGDAGEDPADAELREVLARTIAFLDEVLGRRATSRRTLGAFARRVGGLLTRLTERATRTQLASLHACVGDALAGLSRAELRALQVVVTGDHQARARSLAMQYFQKRFRERPGAEVRVTYGESITTVAEALALVGTRRLDRAVAGALFGDPRRLQQDVLGDAAAAALARARLGPIRGTTGRAR